MNRFHFTEYVKNPVILGDSTIPELKSIVETYPWFQTAQLLYAKALSNSNHVDYYSSLKKTSIVAADRQMLYKLITQTVAPASEKTAEIKPAEQKTEAQQNKKTVNEVSEEKTSKQETEVVLPEIKLTSNTVTPVASSDIVFGNEEFISEQREEIKPKQEEEKVKRVELHVTPKEEIRQVKKADDQIQKEQLTEENKELKIAPLQQSDEKNLDDVIVNPVVNAYIEKEFFHVTDIHKPVHNSGTENITESQKGKEVFTATLNEPHSFTEWLKLISQQKQEVSEKQPVPEQKGITAPDVQEEKKEDTVPPVLQDEKRLKKLEIMDKIIQSNPGPTRITETTQFFSASKTAKASSSEDETLVTETLAWIYEQQGNYPKAIKAYKTLSLKYPEKSVYFASLIQKIKLKQKQK